MREYERFDEIGDRMAMEHDPGADGAASRVATIETVASEPL